PTATLQSSHTYRLFLFHTPAPAPLYTLSLHDALPIFPVGHRREHVVDDALDHVAQRVEDLEVGLAVDLEVEVGGDADADDAEERSEEHTSELQSPYDLVCRLLLEKKKKQQHRTPSDFW